MDYRVQLFVDGKVEMKHFINTADRASTEKLISSILDKMTNSFPLDHDCKLEIDYAFRPLNLFK